MSRGREPIHHNETQIYVRLKQEEKDLITRAAEIVAGGNLSKFTRMVLVPEAKKIVETGVFTKEASSSSDDIADTIAHSKDHARWAETLYSLALELHSVADEIRKSD